MHKLFIEKTTLTPEILFSPEENNFTITGTSAPEDVRALYYPVIDWIKIFADDIIEGEYPAFTAESPVRLKIDLTYFNSSSAKFLYDIFTEMKRIVAAGVPVIVEWYYDPEDIDQKDAGNDISSLAGMAFSFIPKT